MLIARFVDGVELKLNALVGDLDDRGRRHWVATEALALVRGGITAEAMAAGLSDRTIRAGISELRNDNPVSIGRQRKPGCRTTTTTTG